MTAKKPFYGLTLLVFLIGFCLLLVGLALSTVARLAHEPLSLGSEAVVYEVQPGSSVRTVAQDLNHLGYLPYPAFFVMLAHMTRLSHQLKAGEYQLKPGDTPTTLLQRITQGKVMQHSITFVEGWTFKDMKAAIRREPSLVPAVIDLPDAQIMHALGYPAHLPEGQFFPDTYYFTKGTPDRSILRLALETMQKRLVKAWLERDPKVPYQTPYEALIAASLIEKESALPEERPLIASVLINRLKQNMRLQFDPSVIYGLGEQYQGKLTVSDLRRDTPYNTYTRNGLPPTPIALPSASALHAALHPANTTYLYFVAKDTQQHTFSQTLTEHNDAVKTYRALSKELQ